MSLPSDSQAESGSAPLVSVLMPAYNRETLISASIDSVLASTFRNFELIIVDNQSSDQTLAVVLDYARTDPRIVVHQNESNIGDFPNRNRAASYARGTYLKYLDSDDYIYPHGLQVMVDCIEPYPEAGVGLSAFPDPKCPAPILLSPEQAYYEHFFRHDLLSRAPGGAIIRRSAFEAVGGFSGRRYIGDVELWLKLAARFAVVKMPTDLVWDRDHPGQEMHTQDRVEWIVTREEEQAAALRDPACPLREPLREQALTNLQRMRARQYLSLLRGGGGLRLAERYRKRVSLPRTAVAADVWARFSAGISHLTQASS